MKVFGKSDIGLVRRSNQDAFYAELLPDGSAWSVVCDGMGGANGGNIASALAVDKITSRVNASYRIGIGARLIEDILLAAIQEANTAIFERSRGSQELRGMGTTVVAAIAADGKAYVAHAGDSRAYLVSQNSILQLTTDHSMVQEFVKSGDITQQQARFHPQKNIITRALGVRSTIDIDLCQCDFPQEAMLVLCTDGLTNYVEEDTIYRLARQLSIEELCTQLIELAKQGGGSDNITVSVIRYEQ